MPASRITSWLVAYDIADPKRLQRVHKAIRKAAEPVQYSVFRIVATRKVVVHLMDELHPLIDPRRDDIRAYPLLTTGQHIVYGLTMLPAGVLAIDQPDLFFNSSLLDEPFRLPLKSQPLGLREIVQAPR